MFTGTESFTQVRGPLERHASQYNGARLDVHNNMGYVLFHAPSADDIGQFQRDAVLADAQAGIAMVADGGVNFGNNSNGHTRTDNSKIEINMNGSSYLFNPAAYTSHLLLEHIRTKLGQYQHVFTTEGHMAIQSAISSFPDILRGKINSDLRNVNTALLDWGPAPKIDFFSNVAGVYKIGDQVHAFSFGNAPVVVKLKGDIFPKMVKGYGTEANPDKVGLSLRKSDPFGEFGGKLICDCIIPNPNRIHIETYPVETIESIRVESDGIGNHILPTSRDRDVNAGDDSTLVYIVDPRRFFQSGKT